MADVARAHGGDGGNRPPRKDLRKVPSRCDSSIPKVTRGRGCNKKLMDKFEKNGNKPLDLQVAFVGKHGKFVGENQSSFIRFISTSIWNEFPMYYQGWDSVPPTYKYQLWDELYHYFDLASHTIEKDHWIKVEAIINRECHRAYTERKSELKTHFDFIDGRDNTKLAKLCPPSDFNEDRWIELIDKLFSDKKYLNRCEANKRNRQKHHYVSCHGSQSYTQKRWMQTKNKEETSYIEGFEDTRKKDGEWVNEAARLDFE
ncbi:uncharacterized protein LOC143585287 [Bidens hawaiensis]|uniref:uncharacterized protein LOC143585287 n=1 Tax=Bidens hawaiensis TaxID=980011 RepID=UPI00404A543D